MTHARNSLQEHASAVLSLSLPLSLCLHWFRRTDRKCNVSRISRHIIWTLEQLIETRRLWLSLALVARFTPRISRVLATSTNLDTFLAGHSRERNNREQSGEIGQALSTRPCFSRRQSSRRVQSTWAAGFHARVESRRCGNGGKDRMEGKGNRVKLHYTPSALPFFPSFLRRADPIAAANVIVNCGMEKNCARSARDDPRKKKKRERWILFVTSQFWYLYICIYLCNPVNVKIFPTTLDLPRFKLSDLLFRRSFPSSSSSFIFLTRRVF